MKTTLSITDGVRLAIGIVLGIVVCAWIVTTWADQPAVQQQVQQSQYQACVSQAFAQGLSPFQYCGTQG